MHATGITAAGNGEERVCRLVVILYPEVSPDTDVVRIAGVGVHDEVEGDAVLCGRIVRAQFLHIAANGGKVGIFLQARLIGTNFTVFHLDVRYAGMAHFRIDDTVPAFAKRLDRFYAGFAGRAVLCPRAKDPIRIGVNVVGLPKGGKEFL